MNRHGLVLLALLVNMVCYTDRVCISIAAPSMREEMGLSPAQMGFVFSIFSLSYFLGQTPWGILADRRGARGLVTSAILGWSSFTALTAAAWSYVSLLGIRFVFGGLEAALSPSVAQSFRVWVPERSRASAFGFFLGGGRMGGAITPLIAVAIMTRFGWRSMFVIFGALGIAAAAAWFTLYRNGPAPMVEKGASVIPYRSRRLWCLLAVAFGSTFMWQFYITWFPTYLIEKRGFELKEAAWYAGIPFAVGVVGTWLGGLMTDLLGRRYGTRAARRIVGSFSLSSGALLMIAGLLTEERRLAAALIGLAALGVDLYLGAAWTTALDIGGASGGAVAGLMNASSNCAGFASPAVMGWVLGRWHDWNTVLLVSAAATLLSAVVWLGANPKTES